MHDGAPSIGREPVHSSAPCQMQTPAHSDQHDWESERLNASTQACRSRAEQTLFRRSVCIHIYKLTIQLASFQEGLTPVALSERSSSDRLFRCCMILRPNLGVLVVAGLKESVFVAHRRLCPQHRALASRPTDPDVLHPAPWL